MRIFIFLVFIISSFTFAEGRSPSAKSSRFKGNVLSLQEERADGMEGFRMKLRTERGDLDIHVGPQWIQFRNYFNFDQPVEVVGITLRFDKKPRIIAQEIIQGTQRANVREK